MDAMQQTTAIAAVLALLFAALWWLRRRGFAGISLSKRSGARRLECVERLPLGPQHMLHLIRLGDTALLVASSPSGCALVQSFSYREIEAARQAAQ